MKKLVVALVLMSAPAFAQNSGPAPQTGLEHPEVIKGAKQNGAMDTTLDKNCFTAPAVVAAHAVGSGI